MKINKICCIGAGYVGGPTMAVIALKCPEIKVTVVDIDSDKIDLWNSDDLNQLPVYEPGLNDIIKQTRNKNLFFSENIERAIDESEMIFMAVNTPTKLTGRGAGMASDLTYVENSAKTIASVANSHKIVVEKSTLPVRTAEKIKEILSASKNKFTFEVLSNPEFLAEGTAIQDLFKSDRVLIGGESTKNGQEAVQSLVEIYKRWVPHNKILTVNVWSAELSKLASNAMLAQRISSINALSALCEVTGAKIDEVSNAIGHDHRIGHKFLKVSPGFGGSCFKKDILNLVYLCQFYGLNEVAEFWLQVVKINNFQRERLAQKIDNYVSEKKLSKEIAILGWAFKKDTNDSRESSSIYIAYNLLEKGYKVNVYDPKVSKIRIMKDINQLGNLKKNVNADLISENIIIHKSITDLQNSSYVLIVLTEWDEFKDLNDLKEDKIIFDFRNILEEKENIYRL
jgi:UDPglucose 6-dehydrogenase